MASDVKLPRLGQGMEAGTIVKWLKAVGDRVERGEPLYELDTDKVTQEVESDVAGVLLQIAVQAGEVPVGQTIAVIGEAGEVVALAAQPAVPDSGASGGGPGEPGGFHGASGGFACGRRPDQGLAARAADGPRTRHRARVADGHRPGRPHRRRGRRSRRSGGSGRARSARIAAAVPVGDVESIPHTTIRKTIARRLTAAWDVPVFVLTVSVDMGPANALIEHSRKRNPDVRVTVTDLLAKVCAQALMRHPEVNAQFTEDAILRFPSANVGLAVAAPQGLVVPVIHSAERLSLVETALRRSEMVARARDTELRQEDLEGGTFTISNLGMYGVEQFVAILNAPQAAILAVGATDNRAVVRKNKVVIRPMMTVSLTVDHRAVDGAPAAEFLQTVKTFLEEPALAL